MTRPTSDHSVVPNTYTTRTSCHYTTRTSCRVCGSSKLEQVLYLGSQYVSAFPSKEDLESRDLPPKVPIDLVLCGNCTLVQQRHTAPQEFLYTRHYWYRSGVNQTMCTALREVVEAAERRVQLGPGDIVLDIGANDGTLLQFYRAKGIVRVGVEPAQNLTEDCMASCDILINDFWSSQAFHFAVDSGLFAAFRTDYTPRAKVITAIGMFYDLEDPNDFIQGIAEVLHPEGVFIAQLMCLKQTLALGDVGNLCHEHLEFYTLNSLTQLFNQHGLEIFDIEENDVNGGSYRIYAGHKRSFPIREEGAGAKRLATAVEAESILMSDNCWRQFRLKIERGRDQTSSFIREMVGHGKQVWVYGASTKGNVILQWYDLDHSVLRAAADRSPEKWERYTVGTNIPITSEADFRKSNPDYALVLPYAFLQEFQAREREWLKRGGTFIVPIPEFRLVSGETLRGRGTQ